jgi:hypothetical protein
LALDGKRVRASRTIGVSHISPRYLGSVEVHFAVGASTWLAFVGAAVLPESVERPAPSDAPRRTLGMTVSAPLVRPNWHELGRNGLMSEPSRFVASAPSG